MQRLAGAASMRSLPSTLPPSSRHKETKVP